MLPQGTRYRFKKGTNVRLAFKKGTNKVIEAKNMKTLDTSSKGAFAEGAKLKGPADPNFVKALKSTPSGKRYMGIGKGKFKNPNPSVWTPSAMKILTKTECPVGYKP